MKGLLPLLIAVSAVALFICNTVEAGDLFRILNANTLVTARRSDLTTFMYLNSHGDKDAIRGLYNQLAAQGLLVNFQPGAVVEVTHYYDDGTAQVQSDSRVGYIARSDLTEFVGPRGQSNWQKAQDEQ
jgi:hypothetical protein